MLDNLFDDGPDRSFMRRGVCHGSSVHFPELPKGRPWPRARQRFEAEVETARGMCGDCPVAAECLDYSIATESWFGVWGGLTEEERRPLIEARRAALGLDDDGDDWTDAAA